MNYASSSGAAEEVAHQIKQSGGDAITVQADLSRKEDIERSAHKPSLPPLTLLLTPSAACMLVHALDLCISLSKKVAHAHVGCSRRLWIPGARWMCW